MRRRMSPCGPLLTFQRSLRTVSFWTRSGSRHQGNDRLGRPQFQSSTITGSWDHPADRTPRGSTSRFATM